MDDVKIGSNRSFGIVFFIVFLLIALYPLSYSGEIRVWSAIISLIFLVLGLLNSKILTPLNQVWFKFGILLGRFVSPVVMGAIFFAIVTPTAVIMKVLRKNLLNLKKGNKKTYWIEKSKIKSKMKNQF